IDYERFIEVFPEYLKVIYYGVEFGANVQLIGMKNIHIGNHSIVADNVWINDCMRDNISEIIIGESCLIGKSSMINSADYLEIADYCLIAPNVFISNADHNYEDISIPIVFQQPKNLGKLVIEENVWIGTNSVITGSFFIGRGSVIGANTLVRQ